MAKKKPSNCKVPFYISQAGHLLRKRGFSSAGKTLSVDAKIEKAKRRQRGCLNGPPGTFKLTEKQKKNLPKVLQRAILESKRSAGYTIID